MQKTNTERLKDILFSVECCHESIMADEKQDDDLEEDFNNIDVFLRAVIRCVKQRINQISE